MAHNQYIRLLFMAALSFVSMYVLMYAMVNSFENVFSSLNQFYMAGLMAAPMTLMEIFLMRAMYEDKKLNALIVGGSIIAMLAFFVFIRQQIGIPPIEDSPPRGYNPYV